MHRRLARTSVQRSVSKFTKSRSDILGKDSEPALSAKQMSQLQTLFDTPMYMVFLPRVQSMASPSWLKKHMITKDNGEREVTCKRGRPQLLKLMFEAARTEDGAVDYINGGQFKLAGPNVPPSPIQCVALTPEEPSRPWRLEEYEDDDDDEVDVPEGADENPEEENDMSDSVSQDAEMLAPQGLEKAQVQTHMEQLEGLSDSGDEFLAWRYEPEETEALETPADDMTAKQTLQMTTAAEVLRPRGKLTSAEWLLLEREGFIDRLPQVQYTTISKHKKFGAWSTKYPADGGMIHFSRSYGEQRTPLVALLLCLEWLVDRHLETVLAGGDDFKILRQQLETRRFLEVPFAMKSVCVRKILDDLQTD